MVDRFQFIDKPPKIAGHCWYCHDEIQEGTGYLCQCGVPVCDSCIRECWICERKECKQCMSYIDTNAEFVCAICQSNREDLIDKVKNMMNQANENNLGYWHSGTEETDDEIILEYKSGDYPDIRIHIGKAK